MKTNKEELPMTFWQIMSIPSFIVTGLAISFCYGFYDYLGPILSLRLIDLGLDKKTVGYFFAYSTLSYFIGCLLFSWLHKGTYKRASIFFGLFCNIFIQLLIGPS